MSNIPIPPLLCSTPPPIDFGEEDEDDSGLPPTLNLDLEDDDFGEFTLSPKTDPNHQSTDVSSLPRTPTFLECTTSLPAISESADTSYNCETELDFVVSDSPPPIDVKSKREGSTQPLEAFNSNVSINHLNVCDGTVDKDSDFSDVENSTDPSTDAGNFSSPAIDADGADANYESVAQVLAEGEQKAIEVLDEISRSPVEVEPNETSSTPTIACYEQNITGMISLEDVDDSSDDEYIIAKKLDKNFVDEHSENLYAIHVITNEARSVNTTQEQEQEANSGEFVSNSEAFEDDEFDEFTCFEEATSVEAKGSSVQDFSQSESQDQELYISEKSKYFSDYSLEGPKVVSSAEEKLSATDAFVPDSFVNFEEYREAQDSTIPPHESAIADKNDLSCNDEFDDDDFGDFSNATFAPAPAPVPMPIQCSVPVPPVTPVSAKSDTRLLNACSLTDRLKAVLEMMFPTISPAKCDGDAIESLELCETVKKTIVRLNSIDSAKALEYQWPNSDLRHALIRSLGIDSRNVLFGEKWNPSMPRFAANLSGSLLQPLKQQTTLSGDNGQQRKTDTGSSKSDVPAAKFDWNSSGLVNPLDGPHGAVQAGEDKTIHQSQLEQQEQPESHELRQPAREPEPQLQPEQERCFDGDDGVLPHIDASTAAAPAVGAATADISRNVPPNGVGNHVQDNGNHVDLGADDSGGVSQKSQISLGYEAEIAQRAVTNSPVEGEGRTFGIHLDTTQDNEVVTKSTYAGPLKETHIYTPPKGESAVARTIRTGLAPIAKTEPIDFDYEIAAAGIIIDETVVKKEYRDVEYNPGFGLEFGSPEKNGISAKLQTEEVANNYTTKLADGRPKMPSVESIDVEFDEEFSDFQSVSVNVGAKPATNSYSLPQSPFRPAAYPLTTTAPATSAARVTSEQREPARDRPMTDEMILSPAILLPQAISLENSKPKVEWGNTAANINPEELARIEELFPQPKSIKTKESKDMSNSTPPTRKPVRNTLSISASIAQKEQDVAGGEDDDWSEFISVPVTTVKNLTKTNNNQVLPAARQPAANFSPLRQQRQRQQQQQNQQRESATRHGSTLEASKSNCNDDEWSDFVSNAPVSNMTYVRSAPQFNSAAWQNANFYNNPLSFYHQSPSNIATGSLPRKLQQQQQQQQNNNNSYINNNNNQHSHIYLQQQQQQQQQHHYQLQLQQQQQQQMLKLQSQQIHVMQDFSTAAPYRPQATNSVSGPGPGSAATNFGQFQIGSAKVAPSISLIPDLGFVAPGVPTHTALINSLTLPGYSAKK